MVLINTRHTLLNSPDVADLTLCISSFADHIFFLRLFSKPIHFTASLIGTTAAANRVTIV